MKRYHRIARLLETITLIRSNPNLRPMDLAEHFGISRKRVHDDIQDLCIAGVPIVFSGDGYKILPGFFLPPTSYTVEEGLALILSLHLLERKGGLPEGVSTRGLLAKTFRTVPGDSSRRFTDVSEHLISGDGAACSSVIGRVIEGVSSRRTLEMTYYSLSRNRETVRRIDGYGVAHRKNAWYLVGRCHTRGETRTFKIARIRRATILDVRYEIPEDFSIEGYLAGSWGVFTGPELTVRIRFSERIAPLIREKCFPGARFADLPDGSLLLEATASNPGEVRWWVLQYGSDAEVLEPESLRTEIREEILRLARMYSIDL